MKNLDCVPGFRLEPVEVKEGQLQHVRIIATGRRSLFELLDQAEHNDGKELIQSVREQGGLAVYTAKHSEPVIGNWTVPISKKSIMREACSTTRYATLQDAGDAVQRSAAVLRGAEPHLVFEDGNKYDSLALYREVVLGGKYDSYEFEQYMGSLGDGLERGNRETLAQCAAEIDSNITQMHEQAWKPGDLVLSDERQIVHRRHSRTSEGHTGNCMWHTDSWGSFMHALYYPHGARQGQIVRLNKRIE